MRYGERTLAFVLLLSAGGCADGATELVVVIDTDLHVCGEIDEIELLVAGPTEALPPLRVDLVGDARTELPLVHGLTPATDSVRRADIVVRARQRGAVVLEQRASADFVTGEIRTVAMTLSHRCLGVSFCADDETCDEGRCVTAARSGETLPPWDGAPPPLDHGAADLARCRDPSRVCSPVQVETGGDHVCVLCAGGAVYCWGDRARGNVGDGGAPEFRATPELVPGLPAPNAINAFSSHTCTIVDGAGPWCFGRNSFRQVDPTCGEVDSCGWPKPPTMAEPPPEGVAPGLFAASAGWEQSCALHVDGQVTCWGRQGNLGVTGTTVQSFFPRYRIDGLSDVVQIALGAHNCARSRDGTVRCFGPGQLGELGNGDTVTTETPQLVVDLPPARHVAAGRQYTCALAPAETGETELFCWGDNANGQLLEGPPEARSSPERLSSVRDVRAIATGHAHTCVIEANRTVRCWGSTSCGEMPSPPLADVVEIDASNELSCARLGDGSVHCWGRGEYGVLGVDPVSLEVCGGIPFSRDPIAIALP